MKDIQAKVIIGNSVCLALLLLSGNGCNKKDAGAMTSVPVEQIPATIEKAFGGATDDVKRQATEAASLVRSQNDTAAFVQLESLTGRPDLTAEQRQAAFNSWMTVNLRLQQSAAEGNSAAKDLLDKYRATK